MPGGMAYSRSGCSSEGTSKVLNTEKRSRRARSGVHHKLCLCMRYGGEDLFCNVFEVGMAEDLTLV